MLCWASIPVLLRELTGSLDAWTANAVRYPLVAACFWVVLLHARRAGTLTASLLVRASAPAFFSTVGQVFWALAPYHLPASMIGFLVRTSMLWAVLASVVLFADERTLLGSVRFHLGAAVALAGLVALTLLRVGSDPQVTAAGIAIILTCSLFFGLYGVSVRWFLADVPPLLAFGVVSQYVSVAALLMVVPLGDPGVLATLDLRDWSLLLASAALGIGFGHCLFYLGVVNLGPSLTNGCHLVSPFVTLALAAVFLGERLTMPQALAGLTIVAGAATLLSAKATVVPAADTQERTAEGIAAAEERA